MERRGFTLVEIMIVVVIVGLLIAMALPNFITARDTARKNLCYNNLRLLGHASERYITDNNLQDDTVVTLSEAASYIKGGIPSCPGAGTYSISTETEGGQSGPTVTCTLHGTYHILTGEITE